MDQPPNGPLRHQRDIRTHSDLQVHPPIARFYHILPCPRIPPTQGCLSDSDRAIPTLGCRRRVRSYSDAISSLPPDQPLASTNPFPPNLPTTPFRNPNVLSISPSPNPFSSLSTKICLIVTTSRNCLPSRPFLPILLNSSSASSANLYLAVNRDTAGFCLAFGNMDCEGAEADG